ncbi:MAG: hypothetical protein ACK4J0_00240 [Candidatus Anstonellaceae archaeon]
MKKISFIFLIFVFSFGIIFAQSQQDSCLPKSINLALGISIGIISLLFLFGYLFNFEQLKFLAKKEFGELFLVVFFLLSLSFFHLSFSEQLAKIFNFDSNGWSDRLNYKNWGTDKQNNPVLKVTKNILENLDSSKLTIQQKAFILIEENKQLLEILTIKTINFGNSISTESSKMSYINFLGLGFGYSLCSTYSVFRGPVGLLLNAEATASIALFFSAFFNSVFQSYLLCYLLPIGIFLRLLSFTKKAGSLLIALSISFYFVFPTAIVVFNDLYNYYYMKLSLQTSKDSIIVQQYNNLNSYFSLPVDCDINDQDMNKTVSNIMKTLLKNLKEILLFIILKCIFILLFSLSFTLVFASYLAHFLGLDIDLSTLARLS